MKNNRYTDAMIDFLSSNVKKYSWVELTKYFNLNFKCNKSADSIIHFCSRNNMRKQQLLTEEMINFLRANSNDISYKELTRRFNSRFDLAKKIYDIKYYCLKYEIRKTKKIKRLSREMVNFLCANFENVSHGELVTRFNSKFNLNVKKHDINNYCTKYGLRKLNRGRTHPYTLPVGSERVKKGNAGTYINVKVDYGKWKAKHRLLWEQRNGPIPKGCCVIFADGNAENYNIENLLLVTRRENLCLSRDPVLQLLHANEELKRTGISIAKIKIKIKDYNKKKQQTLKSISTDCYKQSNQRCAL